MPRRKSHKVVIRSAEPAESPLISGLDDGGLFSDIYHFLLTEPWPALLAGILLAFIVTNALFAIIYMLDNGIENARPGNFGDAFFFSVQTMATIGYGTMSPQSVLANIMMSIEALTGLVGLAVITGLVFAKFSRPTARVRFSRVAVVSNRDGVPSLSFRMANMRANRIVDATAHVVFARQETTLEGEQMRRFYDLKLQRYRNALFIYSWTAIHPIDDASAFHGQTAKSMAETSGEVIVSVTGLDETFAQTVHARHVYSSRDILWGNRFVIFSSAPPTARSLSTTPTSTTSSRLHSCRLAVLAIATIK